MFPFDPSESIRFERIFAKIRFFVRGSFSSRLERFLQKFFRNSRSNFRYKSFSVSMFRVNYYFETNIIANRVTLYHFSQRRNFSINAKPKQPISREREVREKGKHDIENKKPSTVLLLSVRLFTAFSRNKRKSFVPNGKFYLAATGDDEFRVSSRHPRKTASESSRKRTKIKRIFAVIRGSSTSSSPFYSGNSLRIFCKYRFLVLPVLSMQTSYCASRSRSSRIGPNSC